MIKRILFIVASLFGYLLSFGQEVSSKSYQKMLDYLLNHSVEERLVSEILDEDVVLLDARAYKEFAISRIKNAVWVGYAEFSLDKVKHISMNRAITVYCSVGYRSEKIAEKLIEVGFSNVSNLYGGIFEWKNQKQTIVDANGRETENIHAYNQMWGIWLSNGVKVYD